ncbi:hypothetical protein LVD17_23900 [Fulvivirga ulvae]|uniref:CBU_0592 family membrane protein n=1 Tax=Fulvivirga ulvae TaxID=2904245 RepID=UPI001F475DD2|nr:hypothetical protein [Fulvivirga ulvae]UII31340.1 hypothetical protein LVD17_23900 [Fulvivirga ulvae]
MNATDWLRSIGLFPILLAYFLNVTEKISNKDLSFILLNLIGASMTCLASVLLKHVPFIILEVACVIVSLASLINYGKGG